MADNGLERADAIKIESMCKRRGMSYANLCTKAAIDRKTLDRVLSGPARMSTISKIAKALDVTPDILLVDAPNSDDRRVGTLESSELLTIRIGRFAVQITVNRHVPKENLRYECEKIAELIFQYCRLLDGWSDNYLFPEQGSIIFTMRLTQADTKKLIEHYIEGALETFGVTSVTVKHLFSTFPHRKLEPIDEMNAILSDFGRSPFEGEYVTTEDAIRAEISKLPADERFTLLLWANGEPDKELSVRGRWGGVRIDEVKELIMSKLRRVRPVDLVAALRSEMQSINAEYDLLHADNIPPQ